MINKIFIFLIRTFRPLLGPANCKFSPSCTKFAIAQLKEKSLLQAIWSIIKRIFSCSPFSF